MSYTLPETQLIKITAEEKNETGRFVIEPLSPGYGVTLGNSLRRVLLSSLEGAAVSAIKIDGVTHEFASLDNMREDIVDLILNLKTLRLKLHNSEGAVLKLDKKGPSEIHAKDFVKNPDVEIIDPEHYLGMLEKGGNLSLEARVTRGRGYVPAENQTEEKLPLGEILIDSIYTPVKKVHYEVENTRVEGMTNFDKLTVDITTDGSVSPKEALAKSATILVEHLEIVKDIHPDEATAAAVTKKTVKSATKTKTEKPDKAAKIEKPAKAAAKAKKK